MNAKLNFQSKHKENRLFCTRFIRFLIALAAMTVSTTSAWGQTKSIKYLKYVGGATAFEEATANATQITSSSEYLGGNYYVKGDVTFSSTVILRDDTQIILCDGTTLTINATDGYGIILDTYRLTIYAQSSGSHAGKLIINCNNDGISGSSNVTINGGIISVTSASYEAISCGNFTVNGGAVTAVGNGSSYNGISSRDFTINGGKVSATGKKDGIIGSRPATHGVTINGGQVYAKGDDDGIYSEVGINLGWTNAEDYIESNSYTTLSPINIIKDFYINGSTTLSAGTIAGTTSSFTIDDSSIAGKRLTPDTTDPIYTISLGTGITGGTVEVDKTKAFVGERVAINVTPPDGYYLASLTCKYGSTSVDITQQANDNVFTMPASDVTVNATFNPYVAQIGDTKYPTLQAAFDAIANNETIDILCDITEATAGKEYTSDHNHTINLNGYNVIFDSHSALGSLTINGPGTLTCKTLDNPSAGNTHTLTINGATVVCNGVAGDSPTTSIQWMADHIVLTGGADLTAKNLVFLGGGDGEFTYTIDDNASIAHLVNCKINGYDTNKAHIVQLRKYVNPNDRSYYDTQTSADAAVTVDLRQSWGIELKSDLGEISAGVPKATVTFYDGGTTFDPTAFNPSAYTTSTLYVDNSNGQDRYVIAHIVPELFYWTDLSLLSAVETGTSLTGDANALILLKRDQYDAANAGDPADMRDRYDGAGWYYYTLPKGHSVAAGYTTSTLGGEVVGQFDLAADDKTVFSHDFDNNTLTISRTTDTWKATLTYDKLSWKFTGSFALSDLPKLQSISFKKGDTEMFSQNDADALAGQIKNAYQIEQVGIGDNYLYLQAVVYGCFVQSDYLNSKYKILVPFDGDGSTDNPWQIKNAADLSLLAKCVNVGGHTFESQNLKLTSATYDMSGSDFKPIGTFSNLPFKGNLNCNGATIRNITYAYDTPEGLAVTDETPIPTIGLVGNLVGTVENARLESCSFSSESDSENCYVGSIAGFAKSGSVKDCYVIGGNVSAAKTGSHTGAIVGKLGAATLTNNYYDYTTTATLGSSTASGYTKRGLWMGTASSDGGPTTYAWNDFTLNDGAVLWVKKATISETKPTGSTSSVAFSQTTKGVNRYDKDGDDFYYAVNQPLTLTVTEGQSTADALRTFYDGLSSLTVNGSSDGVDLANRSFSMPEADATIAATFTPSNWFTIPSNGKMWMSFYHEWKDANNEPVNYTVTAYGNTSNSRTRAVANPLELLTIKKDGIDFDAGTATTLDLEGVCFNGVPTLLHQEGGLPEKLRFDPVTGKTAPQYDPLFVGGVSDLSPYTQKSVFMLFNSELVRADLSGDASGGSIMADPHRAFIVVSDAPATSRLMLISDDATGIHSIDKLTTDDADGAWYGIDGRRLQGKPTKRGLYIVNGKKVVIK